MLEKIKKLIFPKYFTTFKPISYKESIKILNSDGSHSSIMERYKALMSINHPDKNGSPFICMKVNEAKKYLLEYNKSLYEMSIPKEIE